MTLASVNCASIFSTPFALQSLVLHLHCSALIIQQLDALGIVWCVLIVQLFRLRRIYGLAETFYYQLLINFSPLSWCHMLNILKAYFVVRGSERRSFQVSIPMRNIDYAVGSDVWLSRLSN